jgi:tryptophan synthase
MLIFPLQTSLNSESLSQTPLLMDQLSKSRIPFVQTYWTAVTPLTELQVALKNKVTVSLVLQLVRDARKKGLTVPVLFMGYYNPILSYGEERLLKDCKEAGINGFIIVDLPPEEAVTFRNFCTKAQSVSVQMVVITATNSIVDSHTFP